VGYDGAEDAGDFAPHLNLRDDYELADDGVVVTGSPVV